MNDEPTPTNGKPYYCALCGAGFQEFMSCEMPDCKLESQQAATARMRVMKRSDYRGPKRRPRE